MPVPFPYPTEVEAAMKVLYRSLRENDRRRYAAVEAAKLGHGGVEYVSRLLCCDPKTIRQGLEDLEAPDDQRTVLAEDHERVHSPLRDRRQEAQQCKLTSGKPRGVVEVYDA